METSLNLNKKFVDSISSVELDDLLKEYDDIEVEKEYFWLDKTQFHNYISNKYKKFELFKFFDKQERKSIHLHQNNKQGLNKVLFLCQ
jgi:uncharacterized protein YjcR